MDSGEFPVSFKISPIETVKGEARRLWRAIIFPSKEYECSFPKGREEVPHYLEMVGSSSEVTFRPLKE